MILERPIVEILIKLLLVARSKLKSRARLEAENIVLRQQVMVLMASGLSDRYGANLSTTSSCSAKRTCALS